MPVPATINLVLVPTDFSDGSNAAARWAATLADRFGARLCVMHVGQVAAETPAAPSGALLDVYHRAREQQHTIAAAQMERVLADLAAEWPDLTILSDVRSGTAHEAICQAASELGASVIVIGTQGLSGLSRFMIGSTAERVVRGSEVPVLTVRSAT